MLTNWRSLSIWLIGEMASKLADKNPHMSLNKIEDCLLEKVCSEQTFSMLSASVESGVPGKQ
jgi:hypothetical protein